MRESLALLIGSARNPAEAEARLAEWQRKDADAVAMTLYRTMAMSDMAGQMFVRLIEVPESKRALDDRPPPTFLRMPFREAVEWFLERFGGDEEGAYRMLDAYRKRGDEASALLMERVAERARAELQRTLEEGGTLAEFAQAIDDETSHLGIEAPDPWYLETVYRTTVQSSYGAGRVRQMTQPAVMAARPFVEFRAVLDTRTTTLCEGLDGKQWRITDPEWKRFSAPLHFNCRSSVVTLDEDEVDQGALRRGVKGEPAPEFDGPADEIVERPIA